jgi:predicted O-methyltransferase YrrM
MSKKTKSKKPKGISPEEFLKNLNTLDLLDGNFSDNDALALMKLAKESIKDKSGPFNFLEIGTWKGKSLICLSVIISKFPESKIFAIDHFKGTFGTNEEQLAKTNDILTTCKNNLKIVNASDIVCLLNMNYFDAIKILKQKFFDFIYIDMDNSYQVMKSVLCDSRNLIKSGGMICGRNLIADYLDVKEIIDSNLNKEYLEESKMHPGIIRSVYDVFANKYQKMDNSSFWYWINN